MRFAEWYEKMITAYADDTDALDLIQESVTAMADYVREVFAFETKMTVLAKSGQYSGDELRSGKEKIDRKRHDAHEHAISGIKMLNRLAEMKKIPPVFGGDITNRYEIADFCGECVSEIFSNRTL